MQELKMAEDSVKQQNKMRVPPPAYGDAGRALYGMSAQQNNCLQQEPRPASELVADLHNTILAQEHALGRLRDLSLKLFGPVPEKEANKPCLEMDHVTALIARSRRLAEEISNRLESISANV
jgi:hypothetical protein